ncbi:uncharacterized protein LOC117120878 [Anneissia japonica]|uniref:uncharacterized protein LOC117120878 n=1 Tax=Anneissia japonica TaxID=1529436 RepID=UPI0014258437|nr:uncharacterized protein LOC117120878 [Anneissia japonica]
MFRCCVLTLMFVGLTVVQPDEDISCKDRLCGGIVNRDCITMCSSIGRKRSGTTYSYTCLHECIANGVPMNECKCGFAGRKRSANLDSLKDRSIGNFKTIIAGQGQSK